MPWIPAGETRPLCPNCDRPIQLFLQLNTADLPDPLRGTFGNGLLQLFYCTSDDPHCEIDCEAWEPFATTVVARRVVPDSEPAHDRQPVARDRQPVEGAFPARRIVGWTAIEDVPHPEEARVELGLDAEPPPQPEVMTREALEARLQGGAEPGFPHAGDKLAGWPAWIQGVEYPQCPRCQAAMQIVFQLDSECNVPYMFGDVGTGHLTQCPEHPDELAFGWACG